MRFLRLPDGMASVTVFDQSYGKDGIIDGPDGKGVEDHIAREIMAHDPRITEYTPDSADDPAKMPGAGDQRTAFIARIASLDRPELFAVARSMRVSLPAVLKTEVMRETLIRHAMEADPETLPMLVVGSMGGTADHGILMITGADADSPNRGNDGLGNRALQPGTTGSTFSQEALGGPGPAAQPAPSGRGMLTPTGTQQPPLNQLATHTGAPANDASGRPFPISVPLSEAQHADVDAHETKAALAVSEAADKLADATAKK